MKHITKFLKLLKNANYRKKISKHVERNIYRCNYIPLCIKKEKNKETKYNTVDQVVKCKLLISCL